MHTQFEDNFSGESRLVFLWLPLGLCFLTLPLLCWQGASSLFRFSSIPYLRHLGQGNCLAGLEWWVMGSRPGPICNSSRVTIWPGGQAIPCLPLRSSSCLPQTHIHWETSIMVGCLLSLASPSRKVGGKRNELFSHRAWMGPSPALLLFPPTSYASLGFWMTTVRFSEWVQFDKDVLPLNSQSKKCDQLYFTKSQAQAPCTPPLWN